MKTQLYRHFASDGTLLYVGISVSVLARLIGHRSGSEWFDEIRTITIEVFPTRIAAESAERRAIAKEKPKYNIAFADGHLGRNYTITTALDLMPKAVEDDK